MNYLELAHQLTEADEPFVLATVVRCEPPASARPGAKAVIRPDGSMAGWVGGSCAQPLVLKEAAQALRDGKSRLVRLSPTAGATSQHQPDLVEYLMTCHSGGTLEIFLEAVLPAPRLCLVGDTPICQTLAALGKLLGHRVERIDPAPAAGSCCQGDWTSGLAGVGFVVIATMGAEDEEALEAALRGDAPDVALVASPRRAAVLRDYLATRGLSAEQLDRLKAPAGLDIGAATQEEIALSIMAEIVQLRSALPLPTHAAAAPPAPEARDPVCGMMVSTTDARHRIDHAGSTYYFCCAGCKAAFAATPAEYLAALS